MVLALFMFFYISNKTFFFLDVKEVINHSWVTVRLIMLYRIRKSDEEIAIGKILCLARTYLKHAEEMKSEVPNEPLVFLKPESAVVFSDGSVVLPHMSQCVHHEVEMGVVIAKDGKHISCDDAMEYVFGYVVALDVTARDIQTIAKQEGWPWSIAKGFDTFAPISEVVLASEVDDPGCLDLVLHVNGEVRQRSNTQLLVFSVAEIISYLSRIMTLKRGDLILTGTPEGVGELHEGDVVEAWLGDVCCVKVDVKKEG